MGAIEILFKEYDTLRAEILARLNHGYQLVGFGATAVTAVAAWLTSRPIDKRLWIIPAALLIFFGILVWEMRRDIAMIARRLQELESKINAKAEHGELLAWESRRSPNVKGWSFFKRS